MTYRPKYDVAISFLSDDLNVASALDAELKKMFGVFFYPRQQDKLGGPDAMARMQQAFREEARVMVVLYRGKWGTTPWTDLEKRAIQDRCMNAQGFDRLLVVVLEKGGERPDWVPTDNICLRLPEYGLEQVVGAIKGQVQRLGGKAEPITAAKQTEIYLATQKLEQARQRLMRTSEGQAAMLRELAIMYPEITRHCDQVKKQVPDIEYGHNETRCVITNRKVSVVLGWRGDGSPGIEGTALRKFEYKDWIALPDGPQLSYANGYPQPSRTIDYQLDLDLSGQPVWKKPRARRLPQRPSPKRS